MPTENPSARGDGTADVAGRIRVREAGLRLARHGQYWLAATAIGAAGGLVALTAHAYQARAATPARAATAPPPPPQSDDSAASAGSTAPGPAVQPPASVPTPAPATNVAPVVSGGS
jgi:hypothetical protein